MSEESEKDIRNLVGNAEEIKPATAALENQESERRGQTQTEVLIKLAAEAIPFHAPDGTPYLDVMINGHRETWPIRARHVAIG
jgi:hypothetical protein